jgi:hypothetical protein
MAQNRLLEAQGTGKSIKYGSGLFRVFSPTIAQHNGIVADPEEKHNLSGPAVDADLLGAGTQSLLSFILSH